MSDDDKTLAALASSQLPHVCDDEALLAWAKLLGVDLARYSIETATAEDLDTFADRAMTRPATRSKR